VSGPPHTERAETGRRRTYDGVFASGRRALTVGLVLTITLVGFEALAVATVMPDVSEDLDGISLYGWAFSGFFLGNLLGIVEAGYQSDRRGPARPFVVGLVLFAIGLLAAGLAPSMAVLVAARVVQGLGAGAIPAIAYVAIGRAYPTALQPRMFAVFSSAWVLPGILGPAVSGAVSDHIGWRAVFLGLLPLVVVAGLMTVRSLQTITPTADVVADNRRHALFVTAGAGLILGAASARSVWIGVPLAVAGLLVGTRAFIRLVPAGTLRLARGLPAAVATRGLLTFAFFGVDAYVSLALTSLRGTSTTLAGVALTAATLTWTAGSWVQERRVRTSGPRALVRAGFLAIALGIAGMILVVEVATPIVVAVVAWGVAGLGMGIAYSPLSLIVLAFCAPGEEGRSTASLQLADVLGIALGTGAAGAFVSSGARLGWDTSTALLLAFTGLGAVAVLGAVAAHRLPGSLPADRRV
jgi:MFS family permease